MGNDFQKGKKSETTAALIAAVIVPAVKFVRTLLSAGLCALLPGSENERLNLAVCIVTAACLAVLLAFYLKGKTFIKPDHIGRKLVGILFLGMWLQAASYAVFFLVSLISKSTASDYAQISSSFLDQGSMNAAFLICTAVLAPVMEEVLFRGIVMENLMRICPFWAANVVQSVFFAIWHGNLFQGIYTALIGLLLGYIARREGSLLWSCLLHIVYNTIGLLCVEIMGTGYAVLIILGALIIAGPIGGILFFKKGE